MSVSINPMQAAQIASAMILIQHTEAMTSRVGSFRQHYSKVASDKLEDNLTKFGAIIAQGIIDAGIDHFTLVIALALHVIHVQRRLALSLTNCA